MNAKLAPPLFSHLEHWRTLTPTRIRHSWRLFSGDRVIEIPTTALQGGPRSARFRRACLEAGFIWPNLSPEAWNEEVNRLLAQLRAKEDEDAR